MLTASSDLHEGNILLHLPQSIDNMTTSALYQKYRSPEFEVPERLDGQLDPWVPARAGLPIWFGGASDSIPLSESRILVINFSESVRPAPRPPRFTHTMSATTFRTTLRSRITDLVPVSDLESCMYDIRNHGPTPTIRKLVAE